MTIRPFVRLKSWLASVFGAPTTVAASASATSAAGQNDQQSHQHLVPYDENLLERSRTQWQFGDWASLAKIERDTLQHHPARAKLALLVAAGHQGLGNATEAGHHTRLALDWGCSKKLVSQILISGVHHTLGRVATVGGQDKRAIRHFESAIAVVMPQTEVGLLGQTRNIRELAKLGMLPQAAVLMGEELSAMKRAPALATNRLNIFETELELLNHELSLAQQRQQLSNIGRNTLRTDAAEGSPEWVAALARKSVSQLGQDLWVLERTGYKRNGFFVEFGATDGVLLSNSWLLEKEFGWQGICAEPNPKFFAKLKGNRQCKVADHCIAGYSGKQIDFIFADAFGGSVEYVNDDEHGNKRTAYRAVGQVSTLTGVSLNDFLQQQGAPSDIDYLSIDTEGSEFEILEHFPFDQWSIRLLTVEHNFTERRSAIRSLLAGHGYRYTEQQWDDWYEREY